MLALGLFLLFGHLEKLPLRQYDEARQAINAMEMLQSGNWLVTTYDSQPETWNTKPPLLIWLQAAFMAVLGPSELAVRLPSALAGLLTGMLLWYFSKRFLRREAIGLIAAGILFTAAGYVRLHGTRTGDFDALLTLFTTWAGLSLWIFLKERSRIHFIRFFLALTLGAMTKGIAALLFSPAYLVILFIYGELGNTLRQKTTYFGLLGFLIVVGGYYLLRNGIQPDYISSVLANEWGGRFATTNEGHSAGFGYYFQLMARDHFFPWIMLIPLGPVMLLIRRTADCERFLLFALLTVLAHLAVISASGTKLEWYALPEYPWLALITAIGCCTAVEWLIARGQRIALVSTAAAIIVASLFYYSAFERVKAQTYRPSEMPWDISNYAVCYFLRDVLEGDRELPAHQLLHWGYDAHARYYARRCSAMGMELSIGKQDELAPGDTVLICHTEMERYLQDHYHCSINQLQDNLKTCVIYGQARAITP